jgi:peptidoglycan-associated lipoprotein
MRIKLFSALIITLMVTLAGCASKVKLNDVPVEDKSASSVNVDPSLSAKSNAGAGGGVTTVQAQPLGGMNAGPAGVDKIVYFDYDSYTIRPEAQPAIAAHARYLTGNKTLKVSLDGHTDERGGREYNLALGQKRADAVRKALSLLGVSEPQMESVSFGKEKPAASGEDEVAYAKNRRVEISYR